MFLDQDDADDAVHHKPNKKSKKPTIYNIQTLPTSVHTVPQMNSGRFNYHEKNGVWYVESSLNCVRRRKRRFHHVERFGEFDPRIG